MAIGTWTMGELYGGAELDGYVARPPANHEAADIDRAYCAGSTCPVCGRLGRAYRPYVRRDGYRAFALCDCGHAEEI